MKIYCLLLIFVLLPGVVGGYSETNPTSIIHHDFGEGGIREDKTDYSLVAGMSANALQSFNSTNTKLDIWEGVYYVMEWNETVVPPVDDDCVTPYEDMTITSSTKLCNGIYQFNDSDKDGAIIINGNNIVLDCSNSQLIGNMTPSTSGIYTWADNNITIVNCNVSGYRWGINMARSKNSYMINNTASNCISYSLLIDDGVNMTMDGNFAYDGGGNGTVYVRVNYSTIKNNFVTNVLDNSQTMGIYSTISFYSNFTNNKINKVPRGLYFSGSYGNFITDNQINNTDIGIVVSGSGNNLFRFNNIFNATRNDDGYNIGIYLRSLSTNNTFVNNTFHYGHVGAWAQKSSEVYFINTTCLQISLGNASTGGIADVRTWNKGGNPIHYREPTACILLGEQYEGWLGDYSEASTDNLAKFSGYNVTNVTVSGVTVNEHVQTYVHTVGVFGLIDLNLPSNWNASLWIPKNMTDKDVFYNSMTWDMLKAVPSTTSGISTVFTKNRAGMHTYVYDEVNYTINSSFISITNAITAYREITVYGTDRHRQVYNHSCSATPIMSCMISWNLTEMNITLNAGETIIVGNYSFLNMPQIYFTLPTPEDNTISTNGILYIYVNITETDIANFTLEFNGTNMTMINISNLTTVDNWHYQFQTTMLNLPISTYTYRAHVMDIFGLRNQTELRTLYILTPTFNFNVTKGLEWVRIQW